MLTLLFIILLAVVFFKLIGFAFRSAWTIGGIILGLIFFPGIMIALVAFGLVIVALPILAIVGLVTLLS